MSGHHHHHDGVYHRGVHSHSSPQLWVPPVGLRSRRSFLGQLGGAIALAVTSPVILVACGSSSDEAGPSDDEADATSGDEPHDNGEDGAEDTAGNGAEDTLQGQDQTLRWARTSLGFVSAYVLARGNRATVVDTGVEGSADAIGASLTNLGLTFNDVETVILTHNHPDHVGSTTEVLARAVNATAYAGQADLTEMSSDIQPLVGGEEIFGLEMLATPGHTAGHMAVIDHAAGLLVAGDAVSVEAGAAVEAPARFTADVDQARASIRALAELSFNTLLVGHGDPLESGADMSMAELAQSLP